MSNVVLVALSAVMGKLRATVNDISDPVGNKTDRFLLDFGLFSSSELKVRANEEPEAAAADIEELPYLLWSLTLSSPPPPPPEAMGHDAAAADDGDFSG